MLVPLKSEMALLVSFSINLWSIHARVKLPKIISTLSRAIIGSIIRFTSQTEQTISLSEVLVLTLTKACSLLRTPSLPKGPADGWNKTWLLTLTTWIVTTQVQVDFSHHKLKTWGKLKIREPLLELNRLEIFWVVGILKKEKKKSNQWKHFWRSKRED